MLNVANRTLFTGDNLGVMRGMNADWIDLIYLDPPFNSDATYAAPIESDAAVECHSKHIKPSLIIMGLPPTSSHSVKSENLFFPQHDYSTLLRQWLWRAFHLRKTFEGIALAIVVRFLATATLLGVLPTKTEHAC